MVIPIGIGNDSMFEPNPFSLESFVEGCKREFDVSPRPHWVTTYYGGHVITLPFILICFFLFKNINYEYVYCIFLLNILIEPTYKYINFYKRFVFNCVGNTLCCNFHKKFVSHLETLIYCANAGY